MIPDAIEVRLKPKERAVWESRLRAATTEQRQLLRIRIVLEAADGSGTREIARELDTTPTTVSLWRGALCPRKARRAGGSATLRHAADLQRSHRQAHTGGARSATNQRLCPLERTADREGPGRRRRAVRLAFPVARAGARATIRSSPARLPMWSASTWRRPTMPSSYVSTRNRRSRRWSARRAI